MFKERYFTESFDRTHTLMIQIKTKSGKWIDYEKCHSQQGFGPKDYITHFASALYRLHKIDKNEAVEGKVRVLNGMRKQVCSDASCKINDLFGGWEMSDNSCSFVTRTNSSFLQWVKRPFAYDAKIASFRFNNSELPDILVTDIETEDGWKKFCKILQDASMNNGGFKSFTTVKETEDDNYLHWYKVKCNSGLQFSFALYA